jgi:hypothetical protein
VGAGPAARDLADRPKHLQNDPGYFADTPDLDRDPYIFRLTPKYFHITP